MHKEIVRKVFGKADLELKKQGVIAPSNNRMSKYLEDYFEDEVGFRYVAKNFNNLKRQLDSGAEEVFIKKVEVLLGLCNFLGYTSYEDYITENSPSEKNDGALDRVPKIESEVPIKKKSWFANRIRLGILIAIGLVALLIFTINSLMFEQRWMVWQEDRYIEVPFDTKKYDVDQLKLYKKERIKSFRKIKADCDTEYFSKEGEVKVWYGKNNVQELECFSSYGLHPETGKTLKPITRYMIDKYICTK